MAQRGSKSGPPCQRFHSLRETYVVSTIKTKQKIGKKKTKTRNGSIRSSVLFSVINSKTNYHIEILLDIILEEVKANE